MGIQYKYQPRRLPDKVIPLLLNFIMNIPVKLTDRARVDHGNVRWNYTSRSLVKGSNMPARGIDG